MRSPLPRLVIGAVTSVLTFAPVVATAGTASFSPLDRHVLEQTALIPATASVAAYTAPRDARVVLKRFCREGCVRCEGDTLGRAAFDARHGSCIEHPRGIELPPGETVRCTNDCPTMGAALFSGVFRP